MALIVSGAGKQFLAIGGAQLALGKNVPVQGLPCDAKLQTQVAYLGFWLAHRGHRKPQLGCGQTASLALVQKRTRCLAACFDQGKRAFSVQGRLSVTAPLVRHRYESI